MLAYTRVHNYTAPIIGQQTVCRSIFHPSKYLGLTSTQLYITKVDTQLTLYKSPLSTIHPSNFYEDNKAVPWFRAVADNGSRAPPH